MNKQELINKLNRRDLPGIGCIAHYTDGSKIYYFYEDFDSEKGLDRAKRQFDCLIKAGKVDHVDYINKDHTTIHFFDWHTKPGCFCVNDEMVAFNKAHNFDFFYRYDKFISIINGLEYVYDYTPAIDGIAAITSTLYSNHLEELRRKSHV